MTQPFPSVAFSACLLLAPPVAAQDEDPFAANVRPTKWLPPEEEEKSFKLPPGFEIQLVAAEPAIQKPLNLAFDERGRLWVTDSVEYPYAAPLDRPGRDSIKVLEDTDGDGGADKITTFADGLNIPIGIYTYKGGAIAWSIPHIWHLKDLDGDGKCDERVKLYGPMGHEHDTHGLHNNFRRGFDGWLYACHGYSNETKVHGTDGHEVRMQSGNTYRMRLDGSRVEQFTWGQVNPFGMCFDALGNIYTADCHTKPIYVLLRGGYYPSFGKPDDGLGFVPEIMQHLHGSTANCGIALLTNSALPAEFRGNVLTGNVMTSRVNRDSLSWAGTTPTAKEETDFVVTTDPWFRPVDLQEGPDGAIYIADFYNRIIGHYEVPLTHPGRDRTSGRIWRVVYKGENTRAKARRKAPDMSKASAEGLIALLDDPVLNTRLLAANQLVDRIGQEAAAAVRSAFEKSRSASARSHLLWILHRLGAMTAETLNAAAKDPEASVRTHAMKVLSETSPWRGTDAALALAGLEDSGGFVARAAADALGQHPSPENIRPLLDRLRKTPAGDAHLVHATRVALKKQLGDPESFRRLAGAELIRDEADARQIASAAVAVQSPGAGAFLLRHVQRYAEENEVLAKYLHHAARYSSEAETDALVRLAQEKFAKDIDLQLSLLSSIQAGLDQRGLPPPENLEEWGTNLAGELLDSVDSDSIAWYSVPLEGKRARENPWVVEARPSADGVKDAKFACSLPRGEQLTGILRSKAFAVPPRLGFFVAGHDGFPDKPAGGKNFIRLRAAGTDEILRQASPPRNDTAQRVEWDLAACAGRQGYLEVADGDDGPAFAWLAVGRIAPDVAPLPLLDPNLVTEREKAAAAIAARLKVTSMKPRLRKLLIAESTDPPACESIARALEAIEPSPGAAPAALLPILGDASAPVDLRRKAAQAVAGRDAALARETVTEAVKTLPARLQTSIARALAGDKAGAELLIELVKGGQASPRLLQNPGVKERILATGLDRAAEEIEELTADAPEDSETRQKLIATRRKAYLEALPSAEKGAEVFEKNCAACHQIAGKGKVIAPQLDGIGNRGLERVLEDILDSNRNVDVLFRSTTLVLKDGKVLTGLFRRQEGKTLVLADVKGEEVSIPESDVAQSQKAETSLMPDNFGEVLAEQDFSDLLRFLLESRGKRERDEAK